MYRNNILSVYLTSKGASFIAYKDGEMIPLKLNNYNKSMLELFRDGLSFYKSKFFMPSEVILTSSISNETIINRTGSKTALITTKGFEDILHIGRRGRNTLYNFKPKLKQHLLDFNDIYEIPERTLASGDVLEEVKGKNARVVIRTIEKAGYEAVAVSFLHSLKNAYNEEKVASLLDKYNMDYNISAYTSSEYREYERTSTTVLSSYITPKLKEFISEIKEMIPENSILRVMGARGGVSSSEKFLFKNAIQMLFSGQVASLLGAKQVAKKLKIKKVITFDIGNNDTNISMFDEHITVTNHVRIDDLPTMISSLFIRTIGEGVDSRSYLGFDKAIKVELFPDKSVTEYRPTLKDVLVFLGYMSVSEEEKESIFSNLEEYFKDKVESHELKYYIEGIFHISATQMGRHIRKIAAKRGYRLYDFTLLAFGSIGGIYASTIADELKIPEMIIPRYSGLFSAYGILNSNVIRDRNNTLVKLIRPSNNEYEELNSVFKSLKAGVKKDLLNEGVPESKIKMFPLVDIRYEGQTNELTIPFTERFVDEFHEKHDDLYGYYFKNSLLEIVNVRVRGVGKLDKLEENIFLKKTGEPRDIGKKELIFNGEKYQVPCYQRESLVLNHYIKGPAIIDDYGATTVVFPNFEVRLDELGNIIMTRKG